VSDRPCSGSWTALSGPTSPCNQGPWKPATGAAAQQKPPANSGLTWSPLGGDWTREDPRLDPRTQSINRSNQSINPLANSWKGATPALFFPLSTAPGHSIHISFPQLPSQDSNSKILIPSPKLGIIFGELVAIRSPQRARRRRRRRKGEKEKRRKGEKGEKERKKRNLENRTTGRRGHDKPLFRLAV